MSEADDVIAALRTEHDTLAGLVAELSDDDLVRPSGASEWDVSQVLSHLGSGAVINLGTLQETLGEGGDHEDPPTIWARWNAMSPRERADGFLAADAALVRRYEALTDAERADLRIELGFLPFPLTAAMAGRMRLNEAALHSWDVRVAFDPSAELGADAVRALLHGEPSLIGWTSKPAALDGRTLDLLVSTYDPDSTFTLRLADPVEIRLDERPASVDGALALPAESWLRLVAGRLDEDHTPTDVETTGDADIDLLRQVFPGY